MEAIELANRVAVDRMLNADPVLVDVVPAHEAIPALRDGRKILHAGPPIDWDRMCGPLRGAIAGIAVFEGWASGLDEAMSMAGDGALEFHPNHHFDAVGPMTGMTTRGQPVMVVENRAYGNRAYCTINEGLGKVMRFGGNDREVLKRLEWLRDVAGPLLGVALRECGGIPLKSLMARGLSMGDEMHQRNVACSCLLLREIGPSLARTSENVTVLADLMSFLGGNDQLFLNVGMAAGKAIMDPVRGIESSSIVTAMCRNGTDFGVRVSGTGDTWFIAPVEMPEGLYFPGFTEADSNPDIGDSTILETIGLGAFAMGAAPAVAGFVGAGAPSQAGNFTRSMGEIAFSESPVWTIPAMDHLGVPTGIDIRRVVETGIAPTINTGIAHKEPGIGQIGAGVVKAPMGCFVQALRALADELGVS
ncbi:MAG: DUF1116 domain-containing protein [Gammaproteobacteria bacterium]|nr:DUF1116 domain-containing protein [Gammaproteobacteria bacterium]MDX2461165.1 DUF1116 domain-containing protein [Gammaproteobacteria bacterium]